MARSTYLDAEIVKDLTKFTHQASHKSAVPAVVVMSDYLGSTDEESSTRATAIATQFEALRSGSAVSLSGGVKIQELKGGDPKKLSEVIKDFENTINRIQSFLHR